MEKGTEVFSIGGRKIKIKDNKPLSTVSRHMSIGGYRFKRPSTLQSGQGWPVSGAAMCHGGQSMTGKSQKLPQTMSCKCSGKRRLRIGCS